MPLLRTRKYVSAILAITILGSSAASAAPAPAPAQVNPYVALSLMSSAGSPAAGTIAAGSALATEAFAAQDSDGSAHGSMMPLWVALGVVFIGWAWILLDNNDNGDPDFHDHVNPPISPA